MDVEKDESSLKASRVRSRTSGPPRTGDWIPFGTRGDPGMLYSCKANRAIADPNRRYVTDAAVKKRGNGGMLTHLLNNNERLFFCGERFVILMRPRYKGYSCVMILAWVWMLDRSLLGDAGLANRDGN